MKFTKWLKEKINVQRKRQNIREELETERKETDNEIQDVKEEEGSLEDVTRHMTFRRERVRIDNKEERERYVRNCCEQMLEASNETENAKFEYHLITAYLNDMQLIENLTEEEKANVCGTVRKIQGLEEEQNAYKKNKSRLTVRQYNFAQRYQEDIPDAINRMVENEKYREILRSDMRHLDNEKAAQKMRKQDLLQEQQNIKGMSVIAFTTLLAVIILILAFQILFEADVRLAYFVSMLAAVLVTAGLFLKLKDSKAELNYIERCMNKAIGLQNRTKIKFVNVENALDYSYEKYNVKSAQELKRIWEYYLREKEEQKKIKQNDQDLDFYGDLLVKQLKHLGVQDPNVWPQQCNAIVDNREMVEIRHRLINRRQKIRTQLDTNMKIMQDAKDEISRLVADHQEYAKEILQIVDSVEQEI